MEAAAWPPAGLTDFGVSQVTLKPGAWSSQRHWHDGEDEFLVMLQGEAVLVEDDGETCFAPGDCAAWPKGSTNGHHLRNESHADCTFIVVGGGANTGGGYSDIDLLFTAEGTYVHKDGTPTCSERPAAARLHGREERIPRRGRPLPPISRSCRLVLLDHPGLVLGRVNPFGDVGV